MRSVHFTLDGQPATVQFDEGETALEVLRERLGVTSIKDGCAPEGVCGCCTVLWDGRAVMSCKRPAHKLEGVQVVTLAGIDEHKRQVLGRAFVREGGVQCGFCIPGIATRAVDLLEKNAEPTDDRIRTALGPHLCRCTGYQRIVNSIAEAGRHWNEQTLPELPAASGVGEDAPRYDGIATVLGERVYSNDLSVDGMLHAAVRLADNPRARVVSIDVTAALAMPGVHSVMTAADLPAAQKIGHIYRDWDIFIGVGEVTHCVGSVIAAVAADSRRIARAAAEAIVVELETLPPITDPFEALRPDAPQVHPGRSNLLATSTARRGDVDGQLAASAHVMHERFQTQRVEHAFLEPEASLVVPRPDGGFHVYTQGQGVHEDRRQLAEALGVPEDRVLVELVSNGGAFGGKEDLSIQQHAALLCQRLGKPVKLALSREESLKLHPKRHPITMDYTVGCDEEGLLTAVRVRLWGDTGGYASVGDKVIERAAGHACGPYRVPSVDIQGHTIYTNNVPCGAFRGFGVNQTAFAMEGMLDRLAEQVGISRYDIRDRNILQKGDPFGPGQIMGDGVGIRECLEAVREDFENAKYAGIACGIKNTGIGNGLADIGRALIRVDGPDHVTVYTGFTEMGQGLMTIVRQVVCEEAGLRSEQVSVKISTEYEVECGMTTASRGTFLSGEATRRAAVDLGEALKGATLSELQGDQFGGEFICNFTQKPEEGPHTHVTFGYAAQVVILNDEGIIERVVAAHDVGRAMNPALCKAQIEGAIHQGLGFALTEDLPSSGGYLDSARLADLRIIKAKATPHMDVRLIEVPDPLTKYGMKGVGEIGLVPTAGAVASALHAYDGIHRTAVPMRGSAAARAMLPRKLHEEDHP